MLWSALKLAWGTDMLLCAGGFQNILYAFGLGYGSCMMANSCLIFRANSKELLTSDSSSAKIATAGCVLYLAYGLRLATFLWRRQSSTSYKPKFIEVENKSHKMPAIARVAISTFVATSQTLYCMPLQLACSKASSAETEEVSYLACAAVGVSWLGLVLEAVADEQKLAAKQIRPTEPVMSGLYSMCRHPNYTGEILFHLGMWGLTTQGSFFEQATAMLSPCFMIWVMLGAAKRLDKAGMETYKDNAAYKTWTESTFSLLPGLI